jgi:hypothetical protein
MKKIYSIVTGILLTASVWSQAPQKMSYQAVIRNSSNALVTSTVVGMKISILKGASTGTEVYVETQNPSTNANGLVSLEIGNGTAVTGTFAGINWANGPYFVKTETDPAGGNNYSILGTSELMSVPYALFSANSTPGPKGDKGDKGDQGLKGDQGIQGIQGEIGLAGTKGDKGETGVQGIKGDQGIQGIQGEIGLTGSKGDKGETGTFQTGSAPGQMNYWNGSAWVTVAPGIRGQTLTFCDGFPTWGPCYPSGTVHCTNTPTAVVPVTNPSTGKIWMDRNLGASQVATSSTDAASYGDLYQWGRGADGHQCRTLATTTSLSSTDVPGNSNFILSPNTPFDWISPQNNNLWQGVNGVNNPCPEGYRIPTETELEAERVSWSANNLTGAFASPLKLTLAGRGGLDGFIFDVGDVGTYWSSTIDMIYSRLLYFGYGYSYVHLNQRACSFSVRCIKDY